MIRRWGWGRGGWAESETLPKHNGDTFISESLILNLYIPTPLTNTKVFIYSFSPHYNANLNKTLFSCSVKFIENTFSAVNVG